MEKIIWEKAWNLGYNSIDEQHKYLISSLNRIINREENTYKLIDLFINILEKHFVLEEDIMLNYKYKDFNYHKNEHDTFIKSLLELRFDIEVLSQQDKEERLCAIERLIFYWASNHFATTDKKLVDFMTKRRWY